MGQLGSAKLNGNKQSCFESEKFLWCQQLGRSHNVPWSWHSFVFLSNPWLCSDLIFTFLDMMVVIRSHLGT